MGLQTGIFADLLSDQRDRLAAESRSSLENPQTPLSYPAEWLLDIFNGGRTDSGIRISELTAFQCTTFLACVDLIAGAVAALPKHVFERRITANGRAAHSIAYDHDLYDLVNLEPNDEMSRFVFDKAYLAHVLAWGNGYAEIQRDGGNRATALWPRNPYKTRPHRLADAIVLPAEPWRPFPVKLAAGELVYKTTDWIDQNDESETGATQGLERLIPKEDMLHVPGLAFDGRLGQSVVWLSRQVLGLALATEKFGAKYFANYARPGGILEAPALDSSAREQAKQSWMEAQGGENSHRVAVLPPGFKFTPISNKPDESQMSETEERQAIKICAFFHVAPRLVGLSKVTSKSSTEQEGQEFLTITLSPWLAALKAEYKRKLFPNAGVGRAPRNRFFVDFDVTDYQRADATAREAFYASGRQWGYLSANDVRAFEKLNPIEEPWAEDYWMPINMTLSTTPLDPSSEAGNVGNGHKGDNKGKNAGIGGSQTDDDPISDRYVKHYSRLFADAFGRVSAHKKRDFRAVCSAFGPVLFSMRDGLFDLAAMQMRIKGTPGTESERFVADYMGAMQQRCTSWTPADSDHELKRAVAAIRVVSFREAATLKAKSTSGETDEQA